MIIKLSSEISNLIAAGEVVERPLSIVKELVENSIDAGATSVEIRLKTSGIDLISVSDNGNGMSKEDLSLSVYRHATSKITSKHDLLAINTLGFRGEALASIAAVSKLTIISSNGEDSNKIYLEAGKEIYNDAFMSNVGTTILVENMFYNTPARLKFLKSVQYELAVIVDFVQKISLANPTISFKLFNDDKQLLSTTSSKDYFKTLSEVYSLEISNSMRHIEFSNYSYNVNLYYSTPELTRSSKNFITLVVNKRVVKNYRIIEAVISSYKDKLFNNRYPIAVIDIVVDPSLTDVNIHPSKQEIKLSKENELIELIKTNLEKILFSSSSNYEFINKESSFVQETNELPKYNFDNNLFSEENEVAQPSISNLQIFNINNESSNLDVKIFPTLDYIGQVFSTYLLFESGESFYIIDQHAAAERVNFEYVLSMLKKEYEYYEALIPIELDYSKGDLIKIEENIGKFEELGIFLEQVSDDLLVLRKVPTWFLKGYEKEYLDSFIHEVIYNKQSNLVEDLAASIACKKSIKAKNYVSKTEVEELVNSLKLCNNPYNCPHGRPTIINYSKKELERMFKRS